MSCLTTKTVSHKPKYSQICKKVNMMHEEEAHKIIKAKRSPTHSLASSPYLYHTLNSLPFGIKCQKPKTKEVEVEQRSLVARPQTTLHHLCHLLSSQRWSDPLKLHELEKVSGSTLWALWVSQSVLGAQVLLKRLVHSCSRCLRNCRGRC